MVKLNATDNVNRHWRDSFNIIIINLDDIMPNLLHFKTQYCSTRVTLCVANPVDISNSRLTRILNAQHQNNTIAQLNQIIKSTALN